MTEREWIIEKADVAHRRGLLVTESNLLMKVYQEIKSETDEIRKQFINSEINIKCKID